MKMFKRLCAGLLAGMLMISSAAAADATVLDDAVYEPAKAGEINAGKYTVSFTNDALIPGNPYALLIAKWDNASKPESGSVEIPAINASTLTYIDQADADANKTVTFTNFIPQSVPNSVVLLGGAFNGKESPVIIGYIDAAGVLVTGVVNVLQNTSETKLANISFTLVGDDSNPITGAVNNMGAFTFESVAEGNYSVVIDKPGYLKATKEISVASDAVSVGTIDLYGGDVNNNNEINVFDLIALLDDWGKETEELVGYSDVNENGAVNVFDLIILLDNFGKKG